MNKIIGVELRLQENLVSGSPANQNQNTECKIVPLSIEVPDSFLLPEAGSGWPEPSKLSMSITVHTSQGDFSGLIALPLRRNGEPVSVDARNWETVNIEARKVLRRSVEAQ